MFPGVSFRVLVSGETSQIGPLDTLSPSLLHCKCVFPPAHISTFVPCSPFTTTWGAPSAVKGTPCPQPVSGAHLVWPVLNWNLLLASPYCSSPIHPPPNPFSPETRISMEPPQLVTASLARWLPAFFHMPCTSQLEDRRKCRA